MTTTTNPNAATLRRMDRLDRLYSAARARGLPPREAERASLAAARRRRRNPTDIEPDPNRPNRYVLRDRDSGRVVASGKDQRDAIRFATDRDVAERRRRGLRRNPSRPGVGQLPQLAALGVLVWAGYQLLQPIIHGGAKAITAGANQPVSGGGGAPAASASNWRPLSLTDTGGVPLEALGGRVRQQAGWIAQYAPGSSDNEYGVGAVFFDGAGNSWQLIGGDQLAGPDVPGGDTSQTRTLGSFAA